MLPLRAESGVMIQVQSLEVFMAVFIKSLRSFIKARRFSRKSERGKAPSVGSRSSSASVISHTPRE